MVCGVTINGMTVPALLKTQAVGMTCLAVLVKAPASDGKSALSFHEYNQAYIFDHTSSFFPFAIFLINIAATALVRYLLQVGARA